MNTYDSRPDTHAHIAEVRGLLLAAVQDLTRRAHVHDLSKLASPEVEVFDTVTPRLRELEYGSEAYKASLKEMGAALQHHYLHNDHHPEHHLNGIRDMNLLQLLEMLCDWMAATKRHATGDIRKSIQINAERFGYGEGLTALLLNTVPALEYLADEQRDVELLREFRAAQRDFNLWKVQDSHGVLSDGYRVAEARYWAAHTALTGQGR
ncbi:DUF5662 family protein [Deinococcus multiflagellatus]|uniref:DUF5662 family protein n=1 Tax=Deinococcus multiflagellatus TaxID=1656887 RepID=A0ABW1ZFW1_9DEIO|nr:DUF5662 family protein [Deinococcus multiflagellatus]MBZ9712192.1 DUF5662 family protein [Deinococcus multiflagellatus]